MIEQITNRLDKIKKRLAGGNIYRFLIIAVIFGFIGVIMITDTFSHNTAHNTDTLKWIDCTWKPDIRLHIGDTKESIN